MDSYINPYSDKTFGGFFATALYRLYLAMQGKIEGPLASDEVQLIALTGMALACSLLGVFTVLRQSCMLANALSHTILLGIASSFLLLPAQSEASLSFLCLAAFATAIITAFLTEFFTSSLKVEQEASIGLVFTGLFAMGIIFVTVFMRNSHLGLEAVMGNSDMLQTSDISLSWLIFAMNAILILVFFKEYVITTFDRALAFSLGIKATLFSYLLLIQTSFTVVGAFRAVGVLMVLAFLTAPAIIARLLSDKLSRILWLSMAISVISVAFGVAITRHLYSTAGLAYSTAGIIVCLLAIFFLFALAVQRLKSTQSRREHS
jgi:manganese/zinc/iron transport system permease protein